MCNKVNDQRANSLGSTAQMGVMMYSTSWRSNLPTCTFELMFNSICTLSLQALKTKTIKMAMKVSFPFCSRSESSSTGSIFML